MARRSAQGSDTGGPAAPDASRGGGRRYSGLSPEERVRQRRQQLLDAALELFPAHGYATTTIEQICQAAAVGLKGFYDEFATKEQLLLALFDQLVERAWAEVLRSITAAGDGPVDLRTLLDALLAALVTDERVARVLFLESTGVSMTVEGRRQRVHREVAARIEQWYDASLFGPPRAGRLPPRVSLGVAGGILELVRDWLVDPGEDGADVLADGLEEFCEVFLAGLDGRRPTA